MTFFLPPGIKGLQFRTNFLYKLGILKGYIEAVLKSRAFLWLTVPLQEVDSFFRLFI